MLRIPMSCTYVGMMYELVKKQVWLLALLISLRTKLCYHRSTHEFATAKWSITKTKQYTPMSGRLIITTKKTYCPWRPENVERILRDERLERERIGREEESRRNNHASTRLELLRVQAGLTDPYSGDEQKGLPRVMKHVNLFEKEEMELAESAVSRSARSRDDARGKQDEDWAGVMPVPLGGDEAAKRREAAPFYIRAHSTPNHAGSGKLGDDKLKREMDPMKDLTLRKNHNDRKEKRKGRYELKRNSRENKKSRHGRKSSNEINGHEKKKSKSPRHGRKEDDRIQRHTNHESESLTKMRQRRQEREQAEAQRAFMVRLEAKSLQSSRASDCAKHDG